MRAVQHHCLVCTSTLNNGPHLCTAHGQGQQRISTSYCNTAETAGQQPSSTGNVYRTCKLAWAFCYELAVPHSQQNQHWTADNSWTRHLSTQTLHSTTQSTLTLCKVWVDLCAIQHPKPAGMQQRTKPRYRCMQGTNRRCCVWEMPCCCRLPMACRANCCTALYCIVLHCTVLPLLCMHMLLVHVSSPSPWLLSV